MMMFRPHSHRTLERPIADRIAVKRPLVKLAGALCLVKVVVRGGVELPTFRFSAPGIPAVTPVLGGKSGVAAAC